MSRPKLEIVFDDDQEPIDASLIPDYDFDIETGVLTVSAGTDPEIIERLFGISLEPKTKSSPKKSSKTKVCLGCNVEKPKEEFRRSQPGCRECESDPSVYIPKTCRDCGEEKSFHDDYRKNRKECIECERAHGRNYRRTTTKAKEWAEANRERMSELQHNHYKRNKSQIRQKEYQRRKEDPHFKFVKSYRNSVQSMLRGRTQTNKDLASCRDEYALWVKYYSDRLYCLEDYPVWHIDHVIPLDMLKDADVLQIGDEVLLKWLNTRPTDPTVNRVKNKHLDRDALLTHLEKLNGFLDLQPDIYEQVKEDRSIYKYRKLAQTLLDRS